jgi:hypothetical protein
MSKGNNVRYDIYKHFSDNYRYALGKNGNGKKTLFCIGINPSTANSEETDTTITKVENIAFRKGKAKKIDFKEKFDSFVMLNIYPLRATDPRNLPCRVDKSKHEENIKIIMELIKDNSVIWVAWGNLIHSRDWLDDCLTDIILKIKNEKKGIKWVKMGNLTVENEPQHPSRVKYQPFSEYYIKMKIKK